MNFKQYLAESKEISFEDIDVNDFVHLKDKPFRNEYLVKSKNIQTKEFEVELYDANDESAESSFTIKASDISDEVDNEDVKILDNDEDDGDGDGDDDVGHTPPPPKSKISPTLF